MSCMVMRFMHVLFFHIVGCLLQSSAVQHVREWFIIIKKRVLKFNSFSFQDVVAAAAVNYQGNFKPDMLLALLYHRLLQLNT